MGCGNGPHSMVVNGNKLPRARGCAGCGYHQGVLGGGLSVSQPMRHRHRRQVHLFPGDIQRDAPHRIAHRSDVFSDDEGDAGGGGGWGLPQSFELSDIAASSTGAVHFDFAHMGGVTSIHAGGLSGSGGLHGTLSGLPMTNLSGLQPRKGGGAHLGCGCCSQSLRRVGAGASTAFQISGGAVSPSSKKLRLSDDTVGAAQGRLEQFHQGSRLRLAWSAADPGLGDVGTDGSGSDDGNRSSATGNLLSNLGLSARFLGSDGGSDGGSEEQRGDSEGRGAGGSEGAESGSARDGRSSGESVDGQQPTDWFT